MTAEKSNQMCKLTPCCFRYSDFPFRFAEFGTCENDDNDQVVLAWFYRVELKTIGKGAYGQVHHQIRKKFRRPYLELPYCTYHT